MIKAKSTTSRFFTHCYNDRTRLQEIWREESVNGTITNLSLNGTTRAKRKDKEIVEYIN